MGEWNSLYSSIYDSFSIIVKQSLKMDTMYPPILVHDTIDNRWQVWSLHVF